MTQANKSSFELAVFVAGDLTCGLDVNYLRKIKTHFNIVNACLAPKYISGVINYMGKIITIIDTRQKLDLTPHSLSEKSRIIILEWQNETLGLLVDSFEDIITIEQDRIAPIPSNMDGSIRNYFSGIYKDEDKLISIISLDEILG